MSVQIHHECCADSRRTAVNGLWWARNSMAFSFRFHITFANISMVLPFYLALSHQKYPKSGKRVHLRLTKAWSRGTALLFVTGAVSGSALSFQLGLLWPRFMEHAGPIIGMHFSLEEAAFFFNPVAMLHFAFQIRVGLGSLLFVVAILAIRPKAVSVLAGSALSYQTSRSSNSPWFHCPRSRRRRSQTSQKTGLIVFRSRICRAWCRLVVRCSNQKGFRRTRSEPIQMVCQGTAALGVFVFYWAEAKSWLWTMRLTVGARILAILIGRWSARFPILLKTEGVPLFLHAAAAPLMTLLWLDIGAGRAAFTRHSIPRIRTNQAEIPCKATHDCVPRETR